MNKTKQGNCFRNINYDQNIGPAIIVYRQVEVVKKDTKLNVPTKKLKLLLKVLTLKILYSKGEFLQLNSSIVSGK